MLYQVGKDPKRSFFAELHLKKIVDNEIDALAVSHFHITLGIGVENAEHLILGVLSYYVGIGSPYVHGYYLLHIRHLIVKSFLEIIIIALIPFHVGVGISQDQP